MLRRSRIRTATAERSTSAEDATIRVENLGHAFSGSAQLFAGVSFTFTRGDIVALCGPSGSGKSTLLSILAGWEAPATGTVVRHGISSVGWVFQNPHGVPRRTALDHVAFPLLVRGYTRSAADASARRVMASFGLDHVASRPFHSLSGGESQRLMLARAVTTAPDLLLVDEPTAQLDQTTARSVNETLRRIADGGSIVMIATHDRGTREACTAVVDLADHAPTAGASFAPSGSSQLRGETK